MKKPPLHRLTDRLSPSPTDAVYRRTDGAAPPPPVRLPPPLPPQSQRLTADSPPLPPTPTAG